MLRPSSTMESKGSTQSSARAWNGVRLGLGLGLGLGFGLGLGPGLRLGLGLGLGSGTRLGLGSGSELGLGFGWRRARMEGDRVGVQQVGPRSADDRVAAPTALLFQRVCAAGAILGRVEVPVVPEVERVPAVRQLRDGLTEALARRGPEHGVVLEHEEGAQPGGTRRLVHAVVAQVAPDLACSRGGDDAWA